MRRCHFCGERVRSDSSETDFHHVIPKRLFRGFRGEDPNEGNLALTHTRCHRIWHRDWDRPDLSLLKFVEYMETIDWGFRIMAAETADHMAAD